MNLHHKELCKHYQRAPNTYDAHFDECYDYIAANPFAKLIDFIIWAKTQGFELGSVGERILADARRIINIERHKIAQRDADTYMPELEDGDVSSLKWHSVDHERMLVLSDIHFPYHDKLSLMAALRYGKEHDVDAILLNGDILDCYQLSKFAKDFRKPSVRAEIDIFRFFIDQLKQRFPEATIYYKMGNHEVRLQRWIQQNAAMFDGLFDLERLVNFKDHGCVYLKDNIGVKFGKLSIIHGHEIRSGMGLVNIARTYYLKAQTNLLFGHWHQQQEYITRTMEGHNVGAWAQGCLCKLDAEYTHGINQWVHGFSMVSKAGGEGGFRVHLKKIIDGEVV